MDEPKMWKASELRVLAQDDDDPPMRVDVFRGSGEVRRMTWPSGRVRTWDRDGNRYIERKIS